MKLWFCCKFTQSGSIPITKPVQRVEETPPVTKPPTPKKTKAPQTPQKQPAPITPQPPEEEPVKKPLKSRRSGILAQKAKVNENVKIVKHEKSEEAKQLIREAITGNIFLKNVLNETRLQHVIDAMYMKKFKKNEFVIREGEIGDHLYVSATGEYQVIKENQKQNTFKKVAFGELAILYNAKRAASIKALTKGEVWVLDLEVYQKIMQEISIDENQKKVDFLQKVQNLNDASPTTLVKVAHLLTSNFFKTGEVIVRQGELGDVFYIIQAGIVQITKTIDGKETNVGTLSGGEYFGELALFNEELRQATVTAKAPGVECWTLQRQEFIENFGHLRDPISGKWIKEDEEGETSMEAVALNTEYTDVKLADLTVKATLGVGGFGRVDLVYHDKKKLAFALKSLKRVDMIQQSQREHVINERDIQINCRSPFIVRMFCTFKDRKYLFFLLESCLGGDLWSLLQKEKHHQFDEPTAKFMAGCVVEALVYLHDNRIIYRDLKPENLLIDKDGYIKLTDFGFAKKLKVGKTYTFAGTPEYVAPEIILNRGHDKAVDYWALGIFIYELLAGKTPFRSADGGHMKTYNLILKGIDNVNFSPRVGSVAQKLIRRLCKSLPMERLGYQKKGGDEIRRDNWFKGFDWEALQNQTMKAPRKRPVKSDTDTSNFEPFPEDTDIPPDDTSTDFDHFDSPHSSS